MRNTTHLTGLAIVKIGNLRRVIHIQILEWVSGRAFKDPCVSVNIRWARASEESLINAVNLGKRYRSGDGELVVFSGLSAGIAAGERVAVMGESGAGKSTFLTPARGSGQANGGYDIASGRRTFASSASELRNSATGNGLCLADPFPAAEFTALENVMMPLLIRGRGPRQTGPANRWRVWEVGLEKRLTHRAGELSGGEQQRVVLAGLWSVTPSVAG